MSQETLARLASGELDPAGVVAVLRHTDQCDECAARARAFVEESEQAVRAWLASTTPERHLHFDSEIMPFLRDTLAAADRETVESHLDDCAACASAAGYARATLARRREWRRNALAVAAGVAAVVALGLVVARSISVEPPLPAEEGAIRQPVVATVEPPPGPWGPMESPRRGTSDPAWDQLVDEALRTGTLPFPAGLASLRGREDALRGLGSGSAGDLAPTGVVVDAERPRFSWPAREGATYTVSIFEGETAVAQSAPLQENVWIPDRGLPRGRTFLWQVEVMHGGEKDVLPAPPAPPATFSVTSEGDHRRLALARSQYPQDHLLHAVLAARAGLRSDALAALRRVESTQDPQVEKLLRAYAARP